MMMLRYIIIFFLGLLTIPYVHSQDTSETTTGTTPAPPTAEQTTAAPPTAAPTTAEQASILTTSEEIMSSITNTLSQFSTSTDSSFVTTQETTEGSLLPLFRCDFTTPCFGSDQLRITTGNEFNPTSLSGPPRAPSSDVTSINKPTNNNELCKIPYQPQLTGTNVNTSWNMWFCYENQCPTENGVRATCESDSYGILSLNTSETSTTVTHSVNPNIVLRDSVGDQCLRFFYYFTVYDEMDWGQKLEVWIRPNNQSDDRFLVGNLTVSQMQDNRWEFYNITFNSTFSPYTLEFNFAVTSANRSADPATNRIVYFALDDIEVYNESCEYVGEQVPITTRPPGERATSPTPVKVESDLGLILGLSLGIGIPVLLIVVGGLIYFCQKSKSNQKVIPNNDTGTTNTTPSAIVDIPLVPTKTKK